MPLDFAITALVTLFVVVDPVGLAPTFLAVTEGLPRRARRDVAVRATIIAGVILVGTALVGDLLFRALGISLPGFSHRRRLVAVRHRIRDGAGRAHAPRRSGGRRSDREACAQYRGLSARHPVDGRARRDH